MELRYIVEIIFWIAFSWIIYSYIGYILLLEIFCKFRKKNRLIDETFLPSVSLIVAAYNEEKVIQRKIEESLNLDYPQDKLEIIIASDCSTDNTDSIVSTFAGKNVILARNPVRG